MVMLNKALLRVVEGRGRRREKRKRKEREQREEGKESCYHAIGPAISLSAWKSQRDCRWHVRR